MRHTVSRTAGPGAVAGYLTLQWLGRTWGATRQERSSLRSSETSQAAGLLVGSALGPPSIMT